jgi:hypothetical protein
MSPSDRARKAQEAYNRAARTYHSGWGVMHEKFAEVRAEARRVIRGPRDKRPEAEAARLAVRTMLHLFSNPPQALQDAADALDRAEHELRLATLTDPVKRHTDIPEES